jgi:tRNA(adenine34) deaminase
MADDEHWMRAALAEAAAAAARGEVPVGAVVVRNGVAVAAGGNEREARQDPTAHAEMLALVRAAAATGHWRLDGCTLYVTLEPCPMCAGALVQARLAKVVFGAADPKAGACGTLYRIADDPRLNHRVETVGGVLAAEGAALLTAFFAARRAEGKK